MSVPSGRRLCLITGASAGIGAAFARVYAARGYDLALTARRTDRLETLAAALSAEFGVDALALPADLADPAAPAALLASLEGRGLAVSALVNNAGYGVRARQGELDWAEHRAFLQVLVSAPAELAHRVLPGMRARRFGRIINVASVLGIVPSIPNNGLYSAAKAFVVKLSESLHIETQGSGVHVTALCPGLTRSEFHDSDVFRMEAAGTPDWLWMQAAPVAEAGYAAVEANHPICIPGAANKAMVALARAMPEELGLALVARGSRRI